MPKGTNPDDKDPVIDDDKPVTEDDLRDLKYGKGDVETPSGEDETATDADEPAETSKETEGEDNPKDDPAADEEDDKSEPPAFVKEFPNIKGDTPEEYAKNLEIAYGKSYEEIKRIKDAAKPPSTTADPPEDEEPVPANLTPSDLYIKQKLDKEIAEAWTDFKKDYDQITDETELDKFRRRVTTLSKAIIQDEGRLAEPAEVYNTAAISLGWKKTSEPTEEEALKMRLKDKAANSRTSSNTAKPPKSPKISEAEMAVNRKMYPGKSDAEIIKELEEYHQ